MSDQEILEKAIQKAIDGGWRAETYNNGLWLKQFNDAGDVVSHSHYQTWGSPNIIFNHDFAKALWGADVSGALYYIESLTDTGPRYTKLTQPAWKYHLQHMVIADNPLEYLRENLG